MANWTTTYDGLVALLETYVEDASPEFTASVQSCINRAEERVFRDIDLSLFNFVLSTSTGSGVSSLARPGALGESPVLNIFFTAAGSHASRRTRAFIQQYGGSGRPLHFCEDTSNIYWSHTTDQDYAIAITYNKRWLPLSGSNQTNWAATNVADLLLYASLVESERFLLGPERTAEFEATYRQLLGPVRAFWRGAAQTDYEPINPTPTPQQTR